MFTRFEEERSDFHGAPPPTAAELEGVVERVAKRTIGWLSRAGWLLENEDTERESDGLAGCHQMSLMGGTFAKLGRDGEGEETDDSTHRVLEQLELMARLASLIPPPWHPLTRFHGVLAPNHSWRSSVVREKVDDPAPRCPAPL